MRSFSAVAQFSLVLMPYSHINRRLQFRYRPTEIAQFAVSMRSFSAMAQYLSALNWLSFASSMELHKRKTYGITISKDRTHCAAFVPLRSGTVSLSPKNDEIRVKY